MGSSHSACLIGASLHNARITPPWVCKSGPNRSFRNRYASAGHALTRRERVSFRLAHLRASEWLSYLLGPSSEHGDSADHPSRKAPWLAG